MSHWQLEFLCWASADLVWSEKEAVWHPLKLCNDLPQGQEGSLHLSHLKWSQSLRVKTTGLELFLVLFFILACISLFCTWRRRHYFLLFCVYLKSLYNTELIALKTIGAQRCKWMKMTFKILLILALEGNAEKTRMAMEWHYSALWGAGWKATMLASRTVFVYRWRITSSSRGWNFVKIYIYIGLLVGLLTYVQTGSFGIRARELIINKMWLLNQIYNY